MKRLVLSLFFCACCVTLFAQNETIRLTHGPYLQNLGPDEVTIVWIANRNSVGWVELAPDDGSNFYAMERPKYFDSKHGIKHQSTIHAVRICGLEPGTTYRYRVFAKEICERHGSYINYGQVASTTVYQKEPLRLTTLNPAQETVSFAMVNDIHGNTEKMEGLLKLCDMNKTDMVLFVGDMVSYFGSEEQVFSGFMDKAVEMFASEKPMFYTRGNHETRGDIAYDFQKYFSPSQEHIYYMFRQGPVCFVALDCGEDKPDSDIEYFDANVYEQYRTEQAEWLKKIVQSDEFRTAPFRVVTCHIPPKGGWFGNKDIEAKFLPILNQSGVDVMLCGHTHSHSLIKAGEYANFPIMINSAVDLLTCDVSSDKLDMKILNSEGKVIDTLTLKK